jgi:protein-S-isoprenylcysteine O-methyltransferase Ste14
VLLPLFFLASGGSLAWWQAWAYCAVLLVPMTFFVLRMLRVDPEFLEWRITMREKERTQRRVVSWGMPVFVALMLVPGLDRRFGWSAVPVVVVLAALGLVLAGYLGVLWVFTVNRWAGRTVETRQGQQVISTGPYAIVRHPMYTSSLLLYLATPVALGSWWTMLPAALCVAVLVVRIRNEEEVLVRELPGYPEYRAKVRYRLLPGVW